MTERVTKPLLAVLDGVPRSIPPVWLMRQAGRYLPEYQAVRAQAGGFLELCFNPELAAEVTLQPVRRFQFDGAILFSDILVVPIALGQDVWFETGEGPRLAALEDGRGLTRLSEEVDHARLAPVYETILRVKSKLPEEVTFLGFCGAPWTVASYMIAGRGGDEQVAARVLAYRDRGAFSELIERLVAASISYLTRQLEAGVDAVQIFDTWAGVLTPHERVRWCIEPVQRIITGVRSKVAGARIIAFPRGIGTGLPGYAAGVEATALGLDWMIERDFALKAIPEHIGIQGNLDPVALLAGGETLERAVDEVLKSFSGRRFVFNLGHGILPATPIAHVERMLARIRRTRD